MKVKLVSDVNVAVGGGKIERFGKDNNESYVSTALHG